MLGAIFGALVALAAHASAAPARSASPVAAPDAPDTADAAQAIRYANAITGRGDDDDGDDDDDDLAYDERINAELDDDDDDDDDEPLDSEIEYTTDDSAESAAHDSAESAAHDSAESAAHDFAESVMDDGPPAPVSADDTLGSLEDIGDIDLDDEVDTPMRALQDAEQSPTGTTGIAGDEQAQFAASSAGGEEAYEAWMRHRRPSFWGRLDVGLSLRRTTTVPLHTPTYRREELWLVATWRN